MRGMIYRPTLECRDKGSEKGRKSGPQPTQVQDRSGVREGFLEEEMPELSPRGQAEQTGKDVQAEGTA